MTKIPLLDIDLIKMRANIHRKTCSKMFTATLFITVKTQKEHMYPSMDKQMVVYSDSRRSFSST